MKQINIFVLKNYEPSTVFSKFSSLRNFFECVCSTILAQLFYEDKSASLRSNYVIFFSSMPVKLQKSPTEDINMHKKTRLFLSTH